MTDNTTSAAKKSEGGDVDGPIVDPDFSTSRLTPGTRVRLSTDPSRIGVLTGGETTRRGRRLLEVQFPFSSEMISESEIEPVPPALESPLELLRGGRLGSASDLRRKLTHVRLTGRLADLIYSMEVTNTEFHAYQFKPVLKMLNSPTNGLLIADEVGLGKTIEAGLIWTELRSRYDLRRLLIVCPAALREKWVLELRDKIGVEARIADAKELLSAVSNPEESRRGFALVCSMQGLRPPQGWEDGSGQQPTAQLARFLRAAENEEHLFDLLIVDEAHHLRNAETRTHELGELLRATSEYLVLLSATPVHNRSADLLSLLKLLDPETFANQQAFEEILRANEPLVRARDLVLSPKRNAAELRELLEDAAAQSILKGNKQLETLLQIRLDEHDLDSSSFRTHLAYRLETVNQLAHVVTRTRKRDVKEWRVVREPTAPDIEMNDFERGFYDRVTEEVQRYANSSIASALFLLATPQRQMTSCMAAALAGWRARIEDLPEDEATDERKDSIGPLTSTLASRLSDYDPRTLEDVDTKYQAFIGLVRDYLKNDPGEKIVVFSTFRGTLTYLRRRLEADGVSSVVMMGGQDQTKQEIIEIFSAPQGPSVLLSSEVGAEGVDLQFSSLLFNYDLPWNPMRLEQRIGRIDRHGQRAEKVRIVNLLQADTIDDRLYRKLYEKLDLCRQAVGDFEEILGERVKQLTVELLRSPLSPAQQEQRIEQTAQAVDNLRAEQERLEAEAAHLLAYGDYILNQVEAAREMNRTIVGSDLREYVLEFLKSMYQGCSFRAIDSERVNWEISLSAKAKHDLLSWMERSKINTFTRLLQSSAGPVRCVFHNRVGDSRRTGEEIISQFHPLVRFVASRQREMTESLRPAVAVSLPLPAVTGTSCGPGRYLVAIQLWSVSGVQSHERLSYAGYRLDQATAAISDLDAERLALAASASGETWHNAATQIDIVEAHRIANDELFGSLDERFDLHLQELRAQNDDRASVQLRALESHASAARFKLEEVRRTHERHGRTGLVGATIGRLRSLETRVEVRRLRIDEKRKMTGGKTEVAVILVDVWEGGDVTQG